MVYYSNTFDITRFRVGPQTDIFIFFINLTHCRHTFTTQFEPHNCRTAQGEECCSKLIQFFNCLTYGQKSLINKPIPRMGVLPIPGQVTEQADRSTIYTCKLKLYVLNAHSSDLYKEVVMQQFCLVVLC